MKLRETQFQSSEDLAGLLRPVSSDMAVLQLSSGALSGRLQIFRLGPIRISVLECNQSLVLSGQRNLDLVTLALELAPGLEAHQHRAQGVSLKWPALMGFNLQLKDFDLRLPAGTKLCSVLIPRQLLVETATTHGAARALMRLNHANVLELREPSHNILLHQLHQILDSDDSQLVPQASDQLIETVLNCLEHPKARSKPAEPRQERHQAAIDLLHWASQHPSSSLTLDEISTMLYRSRTSLFKGCQEHFQMTPQELQRCIRLDLVRQLLLDSKRCDLQGLNGVSAIAQHMGFKSRSHFARRYQEKYGEHPRQTRQESKQQPTNKLLQLTAP